MSIKPSIPDGTYLHKQPDALQQGGYLTVTQITGNIMTTVEILYFSSAKIFDLSESIYYLDKIKARDTKAFLKEYFDELPKKVKALSSAEQQKLMQGTFTRLFDAEIVQGDTIVFDD